MPKTVDIRSQLAELHAEMSVLLARREPLKDAAVDAYAAYVAAKAELELFDLRIADVAARVESLRDNGLRRAAGE